MLCLFNLCFYTTCKRNIMWRTTGMLILPLEFCSLSVCVLICVYLHHFITDTEVPDQIFYLLIWVYLLEVLIELVSCIKPEPLGIESKGGRVTR